MLGQFSTVLLVGMPSERVTTIRARAPAFLKAATALAAGPSVIFMISDTLIAAEKFANVDGPPGSVWITYAAAQIMMAWGMSRVGPYRDRAVRQKAAAAA